MRFACPGISYKWNHFIPAFVKRFLHNLFLIYRDEGILSFWFQVADLIWWILTFRPVSCHSQSRQQCSHQHQCDLWGEGAWDVLQTCGARAWSTCAERTVPDLWWQQRQPQRQVVFLPFRSTYGNAYFLKWLWRLWLGRHVFTFTAIHFH